MLQAGDKKPSAPVVKDTRAETDISRLDFRVGQIVKVWPHPSADKLYCEEVMLLFAVISHSSNILNVCLHFTRAVLFAVARQIDVGEGTPRLIASGLRPYYTEEQMLNRRILVVCNLKPRTMVCVVFVCFVSTYLCLGC